MAYVSLSKHFNHPYPSPIKALAPLGITKTNCDFSQSLKYFNSVTQDIVQRQGASEILGKSSPQHISVFTITYLTYSQFAETFTWQKINNLT